MREVLLTERLKINLVCGLKDSGAINTTTINVQKKMIKWYTSKVLA